jgi:AraC-like DNA-binding protein
MRLRQKKHAEALRHRFLRRGSVTFFAVVPIQPAREMTMTVGGDSSAVTIRMVRPLVLHMRALGVDITKAFAELGVPLQSLFDSEARISHELLVAIWSAFDQRAADPDFGLHILEAVDLRLLDLGSHPSEYLLLHLFANSATVGAGLERLACCYEIAHRGVVIELQRSTHGWDVHYTFRSPTPRHLTEYGVGTLLQMIATATEDGFAAKEVFFTHPTPKSTHEHARVFKAPVRFGAQANGFRLSASQLRAPLVTAQPAILRVVERRVAREVELLQGGEVLTRKVRAFIKKALPNGNPSAVWVAEQLGVSVRTLARKLNCAQTSHQELLDDVRKNLATHYLVDRALTIGEVASLLGFAEQSTFDRAFRRWFAASPREYRERLKTGT